MYRFDIAGFREISETKHLLRPDTRPRASRLKIAGELKIDLAGTSRRSMRDRCTIMIDANTDEPDLTHPAATK